MIKNKFVATLITCMVLSGCFGSSKNIFRDRGKDYLSSTLESDLKKTPNVKEIAQSKKFDIPQAKSNGPVDIELPKPAFIAEKKEQALKDLTKNKVVETGVVDPAVSLPKLPAKQVQLKQAKKAEVLEGKKTKAKAKVKTKVRTEQKDVKDITGK